MDVDLTGPRSQDLNVGQANIRVPKNVGVAVQASGGIGSINTDSLRKEDGQYVNDSYGKTPATIHLSVHGGIGSIRLIQEQ